MEKINLRIDTDNNLHTSLAGLIYLIEQEYILDTALIIKHSASGEKLELGYFDDENGIDFYILNEELDFILDEDAICSHYIIEEGGYDKEILGDLSYPKYNENNDDFISDLFKNTQSFYSTERNFLRPFDKRRKSMPKRNDDSLDDLEITYIFDGKGNPLEENEREELVSFLNQLFGIEEDKPQKTLIDIEEENALNELNNKKFDKKDIKKIIELEHNSEKTYDTQEILDLVKDILED